MKISRPTAGGRDVIRVTAVPTSTPEKRPPKSDRPTTDGQVSPASFIPRAHISRSQTEAQQQLVSCQTAIVGGYLTFFVPHPFLISAVIIAGRISETSAL